MTEVNAQHRISNRSFRQSQPLKLWEYLREHWKLGSLYPIIDSSGRLGLKVLRSPAQSLVPSIAISGADILVGGGFPRFRRSSEGRYTAVQIENGYSSYEDDFLGGPSLYLDVTARGQQRTSQVLRIEPKSGLSYESTSRSSDEYSTLLIATKVLGVFGQPYATLQIPVSLKLFDVRLGDEVMVSSNLIPDWTTGTLGVSGKVGVVIGRRFELDRGVGMLTVLITGHLSYGYAPSFGITAQSNTSGNTWLLTVVLGDPNGITTWAPAGTTAETFLSVGDRVQQQLYNSTTLTTVNGTVVSVAANTVTVTFDSVVSFIGSQRYLLEYADFDDGVSGDQQKFVFVADDADGTINGVESVYIYSE
jgi:hypothetical protein